MNTEIFDLGKIGITLGHEYDNKAIYEKLTIVLYKGKSYISTKTTQGISPEQDNKTWQLVAEAKNAYHMLVDAGKTTLTEEEFLEQLVDATKGRYIVQGNITNAADEEDLTVEHSDLLGIDTLKLSNRDNTNGMGYVILRKNKSFAEQVNKENTIYEIRYDFTLEKNITIPANCVLKFEGGSIKGAHTLTGQNTGIDNTTTPIFDGIIIQGTWKNKASYLSWFTDSDDYSEQIVYLSLLSKKVYLNKSGNLKGQSLITKEVEIDGCNNTFYVYINDITAQTYYYNTLGIDCQNNVSIYNINFVYSQVITNTQGRFYNCLHIKNEPHINQFINIHDVTIKNFDNRNTNPCQFTAIMVTNFDEGNSCNIHDIIIENCINLGDGVAITGSGGISGIRVQVSSNAKATGVGNIYNVTINKLANCNPNNHEDLRIIEDCNGIYICAVPGIYGMNTQININLHDCYFTDVAERCFKIQGKNASIKNIYNKFTTKIINEIEVPIVYQSCIINMQGTNLFVENIYGEMHNAIVHCSDGPCIIKNSILKKPYSYFGSEMIVNSDNAILENCEISVLQPVRSIFYGRKNQDYTIKNCKITLSNGTMSSAQSIADYSSTNIRIENTYIDGLSAVVEYNTKITTKLILKDTFLGIKEFGQMVHNCDIINSKIMCMFAFKPTWDHSEQTIKINNSEFIYAYNATTNVSFPTNSKINLENVILTNNSTQTYFKIVFNIINGTKEAILNNIKYNNIYNGVNLINFEISNGSGNIEFKRNENTPITSFTVINEETPINPLSISYNSNFNPDMSAMPYISTSTRVLKVSNLDFIGKDGVTYYYNNKNVYYRNSQWVDAIGTPIE